MNDASQTQASAPNGKFTPHRTVQEGFWQSEFGKDYTDRNDYLTQEALDEFYLKTWGVTCGTQMDEFLGDLEIKSILEVGSNTGNQLAELQRRGYKNLYGIDIMPYAVQQSKRLSENINIIWGSAFDIPFKDGFFDLVFTSGVLIHISPEDLPKALDEIHRTTKRYIWGFEYFADEHTVINYRGNEDRLWKGNFAQIYLDRFPDLKLVKEKKYPYVDNPEMIDSMFLLEKK